MRNPLCSLHNPVDIDVAIVGGGVAGSAAARSLHQAGRTPVIFEQRAESESSGQAIGLWTNAWNALDVLGVQHQMRKNYNGEEVYICQVNGTAITRFPLTTFNGYPVEFRYVMRGDLVDSLMSGLEHNLETSTRVESVNLLEQSNELILENGTRVVANAIVGADGVNSVVRPTLGLPTGPSSTRYAGYRAYRGVAKCSAFTPSLLPKGRILQVWGRGTRFGATLLNADTVHWFVTRNESAAIVNADARSPEEQLYGIRRLLENWDAPEPKHIASLDQSEFAATRCGDRPMFARHWGKGTCTIIGDACHLSTPNVGQGGALALEDATQLGYEVNQAGGSRASTADLALAMRRFEEQRWRRNLEVCLRSAAVGGALHITLPLIPWLRDNVLGRVILSDSLILSPTKWKAPVSR